MRNKKRRERRNTSFFGGDGMVRTCGGEPAKQPFSPDGRDSDLATETIFIQMRRRKELELAQLRDGEIEKAIISFLKDLVSGDGRANITFIEN